MMKNGKKINVNAIIAGLRFLLGLILLYMNTPTTTHRIYVIEQTRKRNSIPINIISL